ncbi:rod shape-determining protein [Alicyclobacillus tolerans]|uniref:Cell shape-determining protein MreB n=2 Tax=Alicyclobacillus tolerans TaxID=90970 RepID=A0A1M6TEG6_9BACL|nr:MULTISPECIES: rod shape-determining protein [Alicyclobacillus]MDP9727735.1 rod shape-determining protein MreB [Alicyclobacillus tengchongensis]QRF24419.1 rod shape-determining protein [Alicyclobacillus sp. TC]SHK55168.1 rod shape-determining protein MreB [Alicyclobacillus montanus]
MLSKDIGVDLGTANVLVHVKGQGVVLNEPSVVAIDQVTKQVVAVGEEARQMLGRTPGNIVAIRPLREGVIADFDVTEIMLRHFLRKTIGKSSMLRPRLMICVPAGITSVEQKAVREAAEASGAKQVDLIEEPKAAAIGAGLNIFEPSGSMVVDIGGGTTDVAVLSLGDVVTSTSLRVAGDKLDEAIIKFIRREFNLMIGERTAEELKKELAHVYPGSGNESREVRGRDMMTGLPKTIEVHAEQMEQALAEPVSAIIAATKSVLERTPPELAADIFDKGIVLTGGGALVNGLDKLMKKELEVPVHIAEDPMQCVVLGTGKYLEMRDNLRVNKAVSGGKSRRRSRW